MKPRMQIRIHRKNLDHKGLEEGLMDCMAEDLRFNVGDTVYANIGEFTEGKF